MLPQTRIYVCVYVPCWGHHLYTNRNQTMTRENKITKDMHIKESYEQMNQQIRIMIEWHQWPRSKGTPAETSATPLCCPTCGTHFGKMAGVHRWRRSSWGWTVGPGERLRGYRIRVQRPRRMRIQRVGSRLGHQRFWKITLLAQQTSLPEKKVECTYT